MSKMNRVLVNQISGEVNAALEAIAKKHGLTFTRGGGRFDNDEFRIATIKFGIPAKAVAPGEPAGKASSAEERRYLSARQFSHPTLPELGTVVKGSKGDLKVVGWNSKAPKNPIMLVDIKTGAPWKGPVAWVAKLAGTGK